MYSSWIGRIILLLCASGKLSLENNIYLYIKGHATIEYAIDSIIFIYFQHSYHLFSLTKEGALGGGGI